MNASTSLLNDELLHAPISLAFLASCHMHVFLHKCTEIKIVQQQISGPETEKRQEVAEVMLLFFVPQSGWINTLCIQHTAVGKGL